MYFDVIVAHNLMEIKGSLKQTVFNRHENIRLYVIDIHSHIYKKKQERTLETNVR